MKIIIKKENLPANPSQILKRCGYHSHIDKQTGNESFVRRAGSGFYPRYHIYIKEKNGRIVFDLHLDQKKASYAGSHMHNAEYEGEAVELEINRIKAFISRLYRQGRS